jgi:asparagine synthase (glutamine-hydrolysing)
LLQTTAQAWSLDIPEEQLRELKDREYSQSAPAEHSPLGQLLDHDLRNYLPALLHVEDRTSMAVSLESRVPLLDHRIVELMARVPSRVKFPAFQFKHLLRRVAEPMIPPAIVNRSDKKGFPTPLLLWVDRLHSDPVLKELQEGASLRRSGIFKTGSSKEQVDPAWRHWATLNLELWSRLFLEGRAPASLQVAS